MRRKADGYSVIRKCGSHRLGEYRGSLNPDDCIEFIVRVGVD
jgi:hypothetical protein